MIILDTNIASVLVRPGHADLPVVASWLANSTDTDIWITAITRAELLYGIAILPGGAKQRALAAAASAYFDEIASRILPFGAAEAAAYAQVMAQSRQRGHTMSVLDGQIAAIAKTVGAAIATRDEGFADCGVTIINPYQVGCGAG
ncbi:MAG: PIN domain-containing protein [Bifidobacteriaceae bacterium]|nr:PIN domain-containing protein [Bifidobacteriaceae bacterium]